MNTQTPASPRARLLVVEDESLVVEDLQERLTDLGYEVCGTADNGLDALRLAEEKRPDLVLLDIRIRGGIDGIEVAGHLRSTSRAPVVFLTAHADEGTLSRAGLTEPFGYVLKPFNERELRAAIEMALHRHAVEQRLRGMERWLATTLQSMGDGVISVDLEGRINFLNAVAESLTGWSRREAIGRSHREVFQLLRDGNAENVPDLVGLALTEGVIINLEEGYTLRTRQGQEIAIDDSIAPVRNDDGDVTGAVVIFRDRTQQRQAEEERRGLQQKVEEAQRLESLGVLASGIAHDFNNLLTAITGNTSIMSLELPPDSAHLANLKEIERAAFRAANLCSQMLAYAGKSPLLAESLNLSQLAQSTVQFLEFAVAAKTPLEMDFARALPPVLADRGQLQQVITNLVMNAVEATTENGGKVSIRTAQFSATREFLSQCRLGSDLAPGEYVMVEVRDEGAGMTPETLERVFDPFFSTKFQGRGLGLCAVLGIVRSHRGAISIESTQGRGTVCRVLFSPAPAAAPAEPPAAPIKPWRGSGAALFVDDEDAMRMVGKGMLRTLGFEVLTAEDGENAIRFVEEEGTRLKVVILDLTMPGMGGAVAFHTIRAIEPELPVLLISGYHREEVAELVEKSSGTAFLHKPFRLEEFKQTLRALLEKTHA